LGPYRLEGEKRVKYSQIKSMKWTSYMENAKIMFDQQVMPKRKAFGDLRRWNAKYLLDIEKCLVHAHVVPSPGTPPPFKVINIYKMPNI
jgi:hypothetical protein